MKKIKQNTEITRKNILLCAAGGLAYFMLVCFGAASTLKAASLVMALAAFIASIIRFSTLRDRITLPFALLTAILFMDAVSIIYAPSGKFALYEFLKVLLSFCAVLFMLCVVPGEGKALTQRIGIILTVCTSLAGIISIDMLSTRILSNAALGFFNMFSTDYQELLGIEPGVRMLSIFDNPNVFAGCAGLGASCLWDWRRALKRRARAASLKRCCT